MTSKEFVLWLKGFTEGVHEFNVTPKQWDTLKDKLAEVSDEERIGTPNGIITATPGTGYITIANPNIASFGTTTSTTYEYPSGSAWHYTNHSKPHNED